MRATLVSWRCVSVATFNCSCENRMASITAHVGASPWDALSPALITQISMRRNHQHNSTNLKLKYYPVYYSDPWL